MLEEGGVKLALTVRFLNININLNDHWPIADEEPTRSKSFPNKRISSFRFQDYLLLKDQIDHYHLESESSTFVVDQSPHLNPTNAVEWLPTNFSAFEFNKSNN